MSRYQHRALNPQKLLETQFSFLPPGLSVSQYLKRLRLPTKPVLSTLRPLQLEDVPKARKLLNNYLEEISDFAQVFENDEEFAHWMLPVENVLWTFVQQVRFLLSLALIPGA